MSSTVHAQGERKGREGKGRERKGREILVESQNEKCDEIEAIFAFWKSVMNHPAAKLDKKRKELIKNALKMGYTYSQLCDAITGCSYTPHNIGQNDRNQRYDGLTIIFRNADQIDRFINNKLNPPPVLSKKTNQTVQNGKNWIEKMENCYA
jgi:hypothetical protein